MIALRHSLRLWIVVLSVILVGLSFALPASASDASKICQKGGYLEYVQQDGSAFSNAGQCVGYVKDGGTLVPLAIRIDPILPNETIFCGYEVFLIDFQVGGYEIEVVSEIFIGPTGTIDVTVPLADTFALHWEAIEPVGPTLDVAVTVTNPDTGLVLSETAEIACREV